MRNKIAKKSATKTAQSLPKDRPRPPQWVRATSFVFPFLAPRWLLDGSWTLLGTFSPPEAIFGASWPPPGRPRTPPRAIFGPPGTSQRPPRDYFSTAPASIEKASYIYPKIQQLMKKYY